MISGTVAVPESRIAPEAMNVPAAELGPVKWRLKPICSFVSTDEAEVSGTATSAAAAASAAAAMPSLRLMGSSRG